METRTASARTQLAGDSNAGDPTSGDPTLRPAAERPGPGPVAGLPFTGPWLLAPMEGVTEPCFRDLVLARNAPDALGGAFTEFVRVVRDPLPRRVLLRHLGPLRFPQPVGLQLMGSDAAAVAETARRAAEVGAPLVDLNFGCPAKGALRTCAGSALLREPQRVEALVRACADALRGLADPPPLSAKIRAGYDDAELLEDLARAAEAGGAALLTVHCRTRLEGYRPEVDWTRLARAVAAVAIPVCGNGGVRAHADLERMRSATGCRLVMVGQAALGDPWIFTGRRVAVADAARFLLDYAATLGSRSGFPVEGRAKRVKQLLRHWTAGGWTEAGELLREREGARLLERLALRAGPGRDPRANPVPPEALEALEAAPSESDPARPAAAGDR